MAIAILIILAILLIISPNISLTQSTVFKWRKSTTTFQLGSKMKTYWYLEYHGKDYDTWWTTIRIYAPSGWSYRYESHAEIPLRDGYIYRYDVLIRYPDENSPHYYRWNETGKWKVIANVNTPSQGIASCTVYINIVDYPTIDISWGWI